MYIYTYGEHFQHQLGDLSANTLDLRLDILELCGRLLAQEIVQQDLLLIITWLCL